MAKSVRKIAEYFNDPELTERAETVLAEEIRETETALAPYRKRLSGKSAVLFVGGSRAHHYQLLLKDLGMENHCGRV